MGFKDGASRVRATRFIALAALTLTLSAFAPGRARADQSWYAIGQSSVTSASNAIFPSLAQAGGVPYVAWLQPNGVHGNIPGVASFSGSPLDDRPWTELSPSARPITTQNQGVVATSLTTIGGSPYLATAEDGRYGSIPEIRVFQYTNGAWQQLGSGDGPINISSVRSANFPSLTSLPEVGGEPAVAWSEDNGSNTVIHVKRWTGTAWQELGTGASPINHSPTGAASRPVLRDYQGVPYVAWLEDGVARLSRYSFVNNVWTELGSSSGTGQNVSGVSWDPPMLALRQGTPGRIAVVKLVGSDLQRVGGDLNADPTHDATDPKIALVGGVPYVAWSESNGPPNQTGAFNLIRVSRLNDAGTDFQEIGGALNRGPITAAAPDLTDVNGTPVVAWYEGAQNSYTPMASLYVDGQAPTATTPPQLSGTPKVGSQLSCSNGTWTEGTTTYAKTWERGIRGALPQDGSWHAIAGAAGSTYTVQSDDVGSSVRCRVEASNALVSGEAVSNSVRADVDLPANQSRPTIAGVPIPGQTLSCNPGGWTNNPDFQYQWLNSGLPIAGATGQTYSPALLFESVNEAQLSCQVTASNDVGSAPPITSAPVHAVARAPVNTVRPDISQLGATQGAVNALNPLQCSVGAWAYDYAQYTFSWERNGSPIPNEVGSLYRPTSEDYGRFISCNVTSTNLAGATTSASLHSLLIKLPTGTSDSQIYRDGGTNQADPTNLMAISGAYINAIRGFTIGKLNAGIDSATAACRLVARSRAYATTAPDPLTVTDNMTEETRCRILLYSGPERVQPYFDGGVRYRTGNCTVAPEFATAQIPVCPSLRIEVPSIDPRTPPAEDAALMKVLEPVTPKAILWDLNGDGVTDAVCPASAPVLRTILGDGTWQPRAVILDQNDLPAHYGDLQFGLRAGTPGHLRAGQVKVCATSFDPPPTPDLPCITAGTIGRVQFSNANLCPIQAREIKPEDFTKLLSPELQKFLIDAANLGLLNQGKATHGPLQRGSPVAHTVFVPWRPPSQVHATPDTLRRFAGTGPDAAASALGDSLQAVLASNVAAATSYASPIATDGFVKSNARFLALDALAKSDKFNSENGNFAFDQIYESLGSSATVNGMTLTPLAGTAMLLVPTDVQNALPDQHSMELAGQNVASQLGLPGDAAAIPLATAGTLKQTLQDSAQAAGEQVLRETNVTGMIDDARRQGTAEGRVLADQLQMKLDAAIKPFKLLGDSKIVADKDGTATIIADVGIPGLDGVGNSPITAKATVHADLLGHLALRGLHIHADAASFGGVSLSGVDVTYDSNLGVDIKAKIDLDLPPIVATIDIKEFKLGPDGRPQRIAVDYLAGPGQGIPVGPFDLNITAIGFDLNLEKAVDTFFAHVVFGIGAIGEGCPAAGLDTGLQLKLSDPISLDGNGDVEVACLKVANIHAHVDGSGLLSLDGHAHLDAGPLYVDAGLGAAFRYPEWQVYGGGDGGVRRVLQGHVEAVLSNRGLAGCGSVDVNVPLLSDAISFVTGDSGTIHVAGGAAVAFDKGRPPLSTVELIKNLSLFVGCDIGKYYSLPHPPLARDAAAGPSGFVIARGTGPSLLSIEGLGAAPRVKLRSPSGQVLDFTGATGPTGQRLSRYVWGTVIPQEDRTVAILGKIEPGRWTVEPAAGSATVLRVRRAPILPPVGIKAHISGRGPQRRLNYRILGQPGQTVRFLEQARGESKVLTTVRRGGPGRLRFVPGEALDRHRTLIAEVTENGLPRKVLTLQHYTVPVPAVGAPAHIRVTRRGRKAVITWSAAALGARYRAQATFGSGLSVLLIPRPGVRRATVSGLHPGEGMTVAVQAISSLGRSGPIAHGRLAGTLRLGATLKYHKPKPKPKRPSRGRPSPRQR